MSSRLAWDPVSINKNINIGKGIKELVECFQAMLNQRAKVTDTFGKDFKSAAQWSNNQYYAKGSSPWSECKQESQLATKLQGGYKKPLVGELRRK